MRPPFAIPSTQSSLLLLIYSPLQVQSFYYNIPPILTGFSIIFFLTCLELRLLWNPDGVRTSWGDSHAMESKQPEVSRDNSEQPGVQSSIETPVSPSESVYSYPGTVYRWMAGVPGVARGPHPPRPFNRPPLHANGQEHDQHNRHFIR